MKTAMGRCALSRWLATVAVLACVLYGRQRIVVQAKTLERDVFALIAFYQEVKDRSANWRAAMDKWPVHTCNEDGVCAVDPCGLEWDGPDNAPWEGVTCRYQWSWPKGMPRVVTNIHLPKRGLDGPLPRSYALFANITEIDADTNQLSGTLPPEWGCLQNLIEIDLARNRLQGFIPPEYGLLNRLIKFKLDGNGGIMGCVPDGLPPFQFCGTLYGRPCPQFTDDPLIGTDTTSTQASGSCPPYPGGREALAARLRCPVVADFRDSIVAFFAAKSGGDSAQQAQSTAK